MDNHPEVYDHEDVHLMDVPISFMTPQISKVEEFKNIGKKHKIDREDAIMAAPISCVSPQRDVLENMGKQHKIDCEDAIMAVPISCVSPQRDVLEYKVDGDEYATLMEVPIYFIIPQESKVDVIEKQHKTEYDGDSILIEVPISFAALDDLKADVLENEMITKNMHYLHTYTFEQRRKNWIIKNTSRPDGSIIDYVYHHLQTNKKFRSLVEVYNFVVYGEVRETKKQLSKREEILQVTRRRKPHIRGNLLIKHYVVGTCTESCKGVYIKNRREVNYLFERDIPSNIENKRGRENENLYGHQQVNMENDATHVDSRDSTLSTPVQSFFYLWDFEIMNIKGRTPEVFSNPDIVELEGEESSLDLLNFLPKASGKRPFQEDKKCKKSMKRKHMNRDHVLDDILEAQRRSKIDEEFRLDEMRARVGGASSSVVPAEAGLISGVDVMMESQTLTVTPPSSEGTPEISMNSPATTGL